MPETDDGEALSVSGSGKNDFGVEGVDDRRRVGIAEGRLCDLAFAFPFDFVDELEALVARGPLAEWSTDVAGESTGVLDDRATGVLAEAGVKGVVSGSLEGPA
jgi:hypothetical protein